MRIPLCKPQIMKIVFWRLCVFAIFLDCLHKHEMSINGRTKPEWMSSEMFKQLLWPKTEAGWIKRHLQWYYESTFDYELRTNYPFRKQKTVSKIKVHPRGKYIYIYIYRWSEMEGASVSNSSSEMSKKFTQFLIKSLHTEIRGNAKISTNSTIPNNNLHEDSRFASMSRAAIESHIIAPFKPELFIDTSNPKISESTNLELTAATKETRKKHSKKHKISSPFEKPKEWKRHPLSGKSKVIDINLVRAAFFRNYDDDKVSIYFKQ